MLIPSLRLSPFLSRLSSRPLHAVNTLRIPSVRYGTRCSSTPRSLPFPSSPSLTVACLAMVTGVSFGVLWFTENDSRVACEEKETEGTFTRWKQNKIGRYENRLRVYSHPLKVFKYFASVMQRDSAGNPVYYLTPQDFVRSLVPFNEVDGDVRAHGGGLGVTVFHNDQPSTDTVKPVHETKCKELDEALDFFKLADTDGDGLISYQEYVFFLAILSIPENQFDIAFKVFDEDCNGSIDFHEFSRFVSSNKPPMLAQIGSRESLNGPVSSSTPSLLASTSPAAPTDPLAPNATAIPSSNLGVMNYLFGAALDRKLSFNEFRDFLRDFRKQILKLEFFGCGYAVDSRDSSISAKDFATIVISYADYRRLEEYAKRVSGLETWQARVAFSEFVEFDKIMQNIDDISLAIRLYNQASMATSASSVHRFDAAELSRAIKSATGSQLSPTQMKIIYHIFDKDGDGYLDSEEFLDVLKGRRNRGLDQPRDVGFVRYIKAMYKCALSRGAAL